ncbi:hypothetical protein K525DRAFT_204350 [Schizophyllum commune Loenen D]|nr:hypothetical protein K525DRAFT_204350 [Schizophyllum commune Loenen D]
MASSPASSKSRTCTWTCDENDKDFRRLVFSPSMLNQKADVHLDRLGRSYAQLPPYYGLCYAITYTNIYNLCKALQVDRDGERIFFGDKCFTIYKWFERLEAATGVSRDFGLYECELKNGQPILVMVIACSDKAETVPRPAARIEAFKRFLRIAREPMLRRFNQPKVRSLFTILDGCSTPLSRCTAANSVMSILRGTFYSRSCVPSSQSIHVASTWTCDESDEDVRRMVISPGLVSQKADVHRDSFGRHYAQVPDCHALCYAISYTNIVKMCKARPVDCSGQKCDYGDECFTIFKWFERLEAATGITRGRGLHECELENGQPIIMMLVACSDKVETLPRPAARIRAFQQFLGTRKEPMVKRFVQPQVRLVLFPDCTVYVFTALKLYSD